MKILKFDTLLEGFRSPCLTVLRDGETLYYGGLLTKRLFIDSEDNYLLLKPQESFTITFDLTKHYDMSKAGLYSITFTPRFINKKQIPYPPLSPPLY